MVNRMDSSRLRHFFLKKLQLPMVIFLDLLSFIYFFFLTCFSFEYFDGLKFGLVSVVISGLGPDFTRMESFGKVEEFADTLVCLSYHFAVIEPNI